MINNPVNTIQSNFDISKMGPKKPLPSLLERSFLFEVIDGNSREVRESFTLVVPPSSFMLREKNRVSMTKTFGNLFVDDYGPDNPEMTISGISGTAHAFPTFMSHGSADSHIAVGMRNQAGSTDAGGFGYVHKTAFYTFRNNIMRYKYKYKDDFGDCILRVYDLYDEQVYDVILLDFTVNRTSQSPLHYPYTINMVVYNMPEYTGDTRPTAIPIGGIIDKILAAIETGLAWIDAGFSMIQGVVNTVSMIRSTMAQITARYATYLTQGKTAFTSPLDLTKQVLDMWGNLSTVVTASYTNYILTKDAWLNAKETINASVRQNLALYGEAISKGVKQARTLAVDYDAGLDIPTGAQLQALGSALGVASASRKTTTKNYTFQGVTIYNVSTSDTLQSIAQKELGDSSLWVYIAAANKIGDNSDLQSRDTIYLPRKVAGRNNNTYIISENSNDPYGVDIRLDSNGDFMLEGNDFVLVGGLENVRQAVDLKFKTLRGSVIKQTGLGISAQPGVPGTTMALAYLRGSARITLMNDPRIKSVNNFDITINADAITLGMDLTVVGYEKTLPVSVTF